MPGEPLDTPGKCPYCNYPVPPGSPPLCLNCLRPLPGGDEDKERLVENAVTPSGPATPAVTDGASTGPTEPVRVVAAPDRPPGRVCPTCQFENATTRVRCERCAAELVPQPRVAAPPPPPGTAISTGASRRPLIMVGAVLAAALLVFGVSYLLTSPGDNTAVPGGDDSPPPASSAAREVVERVPKRAITASASSTLDGDYSVKNTLDGKRNTAWNSDGAEVGPQAKGVRLTYRFDDPRTLRRIEIHNGYQKSDEVFGYNGRLRRVEVVADNGQRKILNLKDKQGKQKFSVELGPTSKVVLEIEKVWRKDAVLDDVAMSEIAFFAVR